MDLEYGDIFRWDTGHTMRTYLVGHDLARMKREFAGLHWCRIIFEDGERVYGYTTILSAEYFEDLAQADPKRFARITEPPEKQRLEQRFAHVPVPHRGAGTPPSRPRSV